MELVDIPDVLRQVAAVTMAAALICFTVGALCDLASAARPRRPEL